jgi:adenylate cyclase
VSRKDRQEFRFGPFRLDGKARSLTRDGTPVAVGGRALDILAELAAYAGETVSKVALLDRVWPGLTVEENNLQVHISGLRKALGEDWIITVPGRGYRLAAPASKARPAARRERGASAATAIIAPVRGKPSIAILPFRNMSGDREQEYFADGVVEEIMTALSRIRGLFVIARNSSFTCKDKADVKRVGREPGIRYVLEGSVRKGGNSVRITAQLIDALSETHLWADHFDGSLKDIFALQDKVAISVAGVIEPVLQAAENARSANRPANDLTSYDLYLRAYPTLWSSARQIPEALRLLEQAIARDPRYGPALAVAALCCFRLLSDGRSEDREADRLKGADYARRALEVAGDDPGVLANAAYALAYFGEDIGAMMALVDRAVALNPNSARSWALSAYLRIWAGQLDIALEHNEVSDRLSSRARVGTSAAAAGVIHFLARRFNQAVPKLLLAIQDDPSSPFAYRYLAACYALMGHLDGAREIIGRLRTIDLVIIPDAGLRNPEHRELLLSGLRLAMGETA